MKLKIIILLLAFSGFCFAQDSLPTVPLENTSTATIKTTKKKTGKRKKNKPAKRTNVGEGQNNQSAGIYKHNGGSTGSNAGIYITAGLGLLILAFWIHTVVKANEIRKSVRAGEAAAYSDETLRAYLSRRQYYREVYLKSDAWKRKRFVVMRRDNWRCVYCGNRATQVHHKQYAKYNIGKEPIHWLVSICKLCHDARHKD